MPRSVRPQGRRPAAVTATITVLSFLAVTALAGSIETLLFPGGAAHLPGDWVDDLPGDSYLLPDVLLGLAFGTSSLLAAFGMARTPSWGLLRRLDAITGRHWSWLLTVALGIAFAAWLLTGLLLGGPGAGTVADAVAPWIARITYGAVAVLLLVLPQTGTVRRHLDRQVSRDQPPDRSSAARTDSMA